MSLLEGFMPLAAAAADGVLKPLGHHELLLLLLQISFLLFAARGLGELMRLISLPPVVGELLAGVLLGPSIFGAIAPAWQSYIFPHSQEQSNLLGAISWLGVLFLLIVTGLETDLNLILRKGKSALFVSLGGIIVPFVIGFSLGWVVPESFLTSPDKRLVFSLFIATAMSISAVPVIAKVLMDMNLIRRDIGQVTLAAGMTDDTIGWILLSVVSGLAHSGQFDLKSVAVSVGSAILFLVLSFTVGRSIVDRIFRWTDEKIGGVTASLSMAIVLSLLAAALTHELGLEAALGAFAFGILIGESRRFNHEAGHILEVITAGFLAPIFFASAGLKVDLLKLLVPQTLIVGLIVLAVACFGKFVGAYAGARFGGLSHWEGLAMGSGMNARGAMEIIVATIGLSLGILNEQMYSIIVMVAIITSLMAPPLLKWALSNVEMGEEEAVRLELEELQSRSFVKQIKRILMPTRGGSNMQLASQIVSHLAHQNPLEITALFVHSDKSPRRTRKAANTVTLERDASAQSALDLLAQEMDLPEDSIFQAKVESGARRADVILTEASKGYDLVVLGATEQRARGGVRFNLIVDRVVQASPCATMIVKSHMSQAVGEACSIQKFQNILVPTVGSEYSNYAVEVASTIAAQTQGTVTLINVINVPKVEYVLLDRQHIDSMKDVALDMVNQQAEVGRSLGAEVNTLVVRGAIPEQTVLKYAQAKQVDLIIIGSNLRMVTGRVFLGHRVDAILDQAHCPVAVVVAPS